MKKKQLYHPPQLTVVTVRTEHVFQSPQYDLQIGFEERTRSDRWGDNSADHYETYDNERWYY